MTPPDGMAFCRLFSREIEFSCLDLVYVGKYDKYLARNRPHMAN